MRSTSPPTGIANSNQGNITIAEMLAIQNGSLVKVVASSGTEVFRRPSDTLLAALADQSFWNEALNLVLLN
jgi:hypothetical protein